MTNIPMKRKLWWKEKPWLRGSMEGYENLFHYRSYLSESIKNQADWGQPGKTIVSEGLDANYFDMLNYAVFCLIKFSEQRTNSNPKLFNMIKGLLRFIIAVIFILSGFVKAVDLVGFSFKMEEYFSPAVLICRFWKICPAVFNYRCGAGAFLRMYAAAENEA